MAIGLSAIADATSALGDPLGVYDELVLAALVKEKCHLKIDGEDKLDRKIGGAKLNAIGKAAFDQLWQKLDEEHPGQHESNGHEADFSLKKRTENLIVADSKLIDEAGCSALEQRARSAFALIIN